MNSKRIVDEVHNDEYKENVNKKVENVVSLKDEAVKFLLYSYFGIIDEDEDRDIAFKCAYRTYLDLARTLEFNVDLKETNGKTGAINKYIKSMFRSKISNLIIDNINKCRSFSEQGDFNEWHKKVCEEIIKNANNMKYQKEGEAEKDILDQKIVCGQAQKWLNMTLKYLWLLGKVDGEFLHVPVDSFIMEAAAGRKRKKHKSTEGIKVKLRDIKLETYSEESALKWSNWNNDDMYIQFQTDILNSPELKEKTPIEWENDAWINVSENRKMAEARNYSNIVKMNIS